MPMPTMAYLYRFELSRNVARTMMKMNHDSLRFDFVSSRANVADDKGQVFQDATPFMAMQFECTRQPLHSIV